jgi:hypothetical protein
MTAKAFRAYECHSGKTSAFLNYNMKKRLYQPETHTFEKEFLGVLSINIWSSFMTLA